MRSNSLPVTFYTAEQASAAVYIVMPQRKRTTEKHLEKRSGEGNVDNRLQVQLEGDGDGITGQSEVGTSSLWRIQ